MNKKLLTMILTLTIIFFNMPVTVNAATGDGITKVNNEKREEVKNFLDMPDNWSTAALQNAVNNGLITGYETKSGKEIRPEGYLTRAEMATIINKCFGAVEQVDLTGVSDVPAKAWYTGEMGKAAKMGTFQIDHSMRPNDKITRQEAFAVIARAFKMENSNQDASALVNFQDKDKIASWAKSSVNSLVEGGYVLGTAGKINPTANITRAEFAKIMDNLISQYIKTSGEVTHALDGNVMVNVPDVTLRNLTVNGDLILGDGVGNGDVTLDNIIVEGRTVIRGGGVNSIIITGNSKIKNLIISKVDGNIRLAVEGNANVETVVVNDGKDDVIVQGHVQNLDVESGNVPVVLQGAEIKNVRINAADTVLTVGEATSIDRIFIAEVAENAIVLEKEGSRVGWIERDKASSSGNNSSSPGSGSNGNSGNSNRELAVSNIQYVKKNGGIYLTFTEPAKKENVKAYEIELEGIGSKWEVSSGFDVGVDMMYEAASLHAVKEGMIPAGNIKVSSIAANGTVLESGVNQAFPFVITVNGAPLDFTAAAHESQITITSDVIDSTADYMLLISRINASEEVSDDMGIQISGGKWNNRQYTIDLTEELGKIGMFSDITDIPSQLNVRLYKITKVSTSGLTVTRAQENPVSITK